jgi:hypothetical protein
MAQAPSSWPGGVLGQDSIQIEILQSDPNAAARLRAARLLGMQGGQTAIPALAQAAAFDPDRQVRTMGGDAIAQIRRRTANAWAVRPPAGLDSQRALVESWYQLYLRRAADEAGMRDYLDRLRRGVGPIDVQAAMLGSDEYYQLHGNRPRAWVAGLYADVLARSPSVREIQDWIQTLGKNNGSREQTAADFLRAAQAELAQQQRP